MSQSRENRPFILRYVYGILAIIAVGGAAVIVSLFVVQQTELEARNRIEFVHFASVTESEELAREAYMLHELILDRLDAEQPDPRRVVDIATVQIGHTGILQSMRSRLLRLSELLTGSEGAVFTMTLERLTDRFDRVDRALRYSDYSTEVLASMDVLARTIEQYDRLHQIAAERELQALAERQSRRPRFLATLLACLALSAVAVVYLIRSLSSSMRRQHDTEVALAESQERLHHIQKLDALGRLVGGIAHDFNNWLTVILGHTELLKEKVADDEHVAGGLSEIRQAGQQAASLTQQLLAFSRRQQLVPRILNLNDELAGMAPMLRRIIGEDVRLTFRYANDPYTAEVDPDQLQHVVMNLISNARDAMPEGGELTVRTDNIVVGGRGTTVDGVPDGEYARLTVADTGTGMDDETRRRMFEPFFTTKEQGLGTGLGLSTVHGIVTGSNAYIVVDSVEGSGSRLQIYFPRVEGSVGARADSDEDAQPQRGTETILVVEDDKHVRKFVEAGLSSLGYRVLSAPGGAAGLEVCRNEPGVIDVVLSDVIMPEISGPKFVAGALKLRPDAVAIYMSAYTRDEVLRFRRPGEVDVPLISKPFTLEALSRFIRQQLDNRT